MYFPERSRAEWLVALAVFFVSCAYLGLFRDARAFGKDEGIVLEGAERVLRGQVLYRDFFSFLSPGSFYWMALLFKVFGSTVRVARAPLIIYGGLYSSLTYLIARRASSRWASLAVTYMLLVSMLPFRFQALHNWDSTLWGLLALYTAVLALQTRRALWAAATGTFVAWTFLFEQSKGGGLALGLLVAFTCLAYARPEIGFRRPRVWLAASGGFVWPFVVVAGYWAHAGALREMWNDWLWPVYHYTAANSTFYGILFPYYQDWADIFRNASWLARVFVILILSPSIVIALLPPLALGALAFCVLDWVRKKQLGERLSYDLLLSAVACGAALSVVIKRAEVAQMIFVEPLLIFVLAWVLERRSPVRWVPAPARWKLTAFLLVSFTLFGWVFVRIALESPAPVPTRRGNFTVDQDRAALNYLLANTQAGEKVFVYPYAADLYFLTDTYSPTRFDYLQPGMHTQEQFEESVRAVGADRTPLIMYDLSFFDYMLPRAWPSTPPSALAEEPLRGLLISSYRPCAVVGRPDQDRFVAFWRRDLPCPPVSPDPKSSMVRFESDQKPNQRAP